VKSAPLKLMALILLTMLVLPLASSEDARSMEKYLDCLTDKKVDIVFVFDTTGSMEGEINELSAIARGFASDLEASRVDHSLGLVEFRDFPKTCGGGDEAKCGSPGDFPYKAKGDGNLTGDISTFNSWLRELKVGGGGGPEAVLAALRHAVSNCQWRDDAEKVIIVLTDAGPHPDGDCCNAEGDTLEGTIFGLTGLGARVHVIGSEDVALRRIAGETGGKFFKIRSGLSLKPLLKEITGAMSCSFRVEAETTCQNRTLEAKVRLVGKEIIPFVAGQTEAWMYLDQAGSKSRYNLSYDQAAGAYLASVSEVCGPVELTVYGRAGERSAVQTVQVDCGTCGDAASAAKQVDLNQPPEITSLVADPASPQNVGAAISWIVEAKDPDGDQVLYRFLQDDEPKTDWQTEDRWTWTTSDTGVYRIEAQVRDGKHAGTNGMDDRTAKKFEIGDFSVENATSINATVNASIDLETGALILAGHSDRVNSVAFSPDGRTLASGSGSKMDIAYDVKDPGWPATDNAIKLWDVASGTEIRTLTGHSDRVNSVVFSPDGSTLASGSGSNTIGWTVDNFDLDPTGPGTIDNTIKLWDVNTGTEIRNLVGHSAAVRSVAFSPDSHTLASGSGSNASIQGDLIKLWDVASGAEIRTLTGRNRYDGVLSVAFSPDGLTLASGNYDNTIKLWDTSSGTEITTLAGHSNSVYSVAFSPDGRVLASGSSDRTIKLWDVASGTEIRTLTGNSNVVLSVAFSPDGLTLASGCIDSTIKLWDVASGMEIKTLTGHTDQVRCVTFSPDGQTLASGSWDGTIRLWVVR